MRTSNSGTALRFRAGTILIYLFSLLLTGSAVAKLIPIPQVASQMAALGFDGGKLVLIAVLEVVSTALFAYAPTRSVGSLMLSAYLGGAIATHLGHNQPPVWPAILRPTIVLALVWIAAWLRNPEMLRSLKGTAFKAGIPPSRAKSDFGGAA